MDARYDVLIIGGGQAGVPLARALAAAGKRVALAERKWLGGSCVNFGCTPTKAAFASARLAHRARRAAEYGLRVPTVEVDFGAVLERARAIAVDMRHHLEDALRGTGNPALLEGHARFQGRSGDCFRLSVNEREVLAEQVVIDTGTRSAIPPIDGVDAIDAIHSENWLDHTRLPRRLLIVGAGYIGLEMGQFYARMGSEVEIVDRGEQVAGNEDADVAEALREVLASEGIRFRLGATVDGFRRTGGGIEAVIRKVDAGEAGGSEAGGSEAGGSEAAGSEAAGSAADGGGDGTETLQASDVFLALGRRPNTDALDLDTVGLSPDEHGILHTDARLATPVAGIWAAGDVRGGPMFTHSAWDDYRVLTSQLLGNGSRTLDRIVPYAMFTDPALGRVGLGEQEARRQGRDVRVGRFDMSHNGKARELGETAGFIKVVVDAADDHLLGAAVLAAEAAELVHIYVTLMNADAPCSTIEQAIHIHPTLAEAVQSAIGAIG